MLRAITNNKILESCLSDEFLQSVEASLVPAIEAKYGSADIFMYEDLLRSELLIDGNWYYPLTVIVSGAPTTQWISWEVKPSDFKDKNPYAYFGREPIEFSLCDIPESLKDGFSDYIGYSGKVGIKINVEAVARDITFLSGRYSQRFVDELSRQITAKISSLLSCEGLAESPLSLLLTFAPESYFEHTSENVTYRRLLLIDKGSQPRDFWVKWTRLNSAVGYSVSDDVVTGDIEFDLGEDVPQKIREKEYRFLLREGREKYQSAMGRKCVTEWREIIRRAIKRGELLKVESAPKEITFDDDLSAKLKGILGDSYKPSAKEAMVDEKPLGDDYIKALEIAKEFVESDKQDEGDKITEIAFPEEEAAALEIFDLGATDTDSAPEAKEESADIFDLPWLENTDDAPTIGQAPKDEGTHELVIEEIHDAEPAGAPAEPCNEDAQSAQSVEDDTVHGEAKVKVIKTLGEVSLIADDSRTEALREAEARAGELSIRLEYEKQMRARLEDELSRLKSVEERLVRENEELRAAVSADEIKYREAEERFKLEIARLTAQNEMLARSEEKQKERLAVAARDAVERQRLLEADKKRIEEENARLARDAAEAAAATPTPAPTPAPAPEAVKVDIPTPEVDNYTYVSKNVKLLFRRPVDPNVTSRIYEIIKATLEYFGKEKVNLRIRATVPDNETVNLEFTSIPMEEMQLLSNIIQVLGSSGLGIAKAIVE